MRQFLPLPLLLLINLSTIGQMDCRSAEYKQELIRKTPGLVTKIQEIEGFTRKLQETAKIAVTGGLDHDGKAVPVITIPVIVHILYNSPEQNISEAQVLSQIEVLNKDYRKLNADTAGVPKYYNSLAADCGFRFALAKVDTNGYATTGIVRKHTNVQAFDINDRIKCSAKGGDDAWDRDRYLNIWVGNLTGGIVGYSSVAGGPKETDGVTILYKAFGTMGTAAAPFNLGRTATHEIGHWLNMIHIWGDADCGNDEVDDTPTQQTANRGNPSGIKITCGNGPYGDMYMDYMDFTDDRGMHMFTYGQRDRMRTLFAEGGFRYALLSSNALTAGPVAASLTNGSIPATDEGPHINIYPNPTINAVLVTMTDESRIGSLLEVYNQVGQKIMSVRVDQLSLQLNLSFLPRGLYFIRVNDGRQKSMTKLVKI